jgi:Zn-dependent peptidase ImmA (M78 family)/transcriptional regulator with XRE-family HTH domain
VNRLRSYRFIEDINQEELGRRLGISTPMVSAIESGRRAMSVDLTQLGYSPERFDIPDMSEPLHRTRASTKVASKKRAQELLRLAGEVFSELREVTDRAPRTTLERLQTPPESLDDVEDWATEIRYMLQHEESGPIRNLTASVERAGVCIVPLTALPGIDGLSAWVNDVPVIGISTSIPGDRFRFTLAHEVMHLTAHRRPTDYTESEANRFAGALLISRSDLDAALPPHPQLRDFINLKSSWGIAASALVYRAHELGHLNDKRYRALQIQMSKWRKSEPGTFAPAFGQLLSKLIEVNEGVEKVASKLGLNKAHLAQLTNWSHLRVA